jgi:hypothetical protein
MATVKSKTMGAPAVPFMTEFVPLNRLWEGTAAPYPSEHSARWAIRKMSDELARAQAIAMPRGRMMIHPQRFAQVAEKAAIDAFSNRNLRSGF